MQDLNSINLKMITPANILSEYVKTIWFAYNDSNQEELPFKILSDACSGIVINFGDEIEYKLKDHDHIAKQETTIMGPTKNLTTMVFRGKVCAIGIRFYPHTGQMFLGRQMSHYINQNCSATEDDMLSCSDFYKELAQVMLNEKSWDQICNKVEVYLNIILQASLDKFPVKLKDLITIIERTPEINITELSDKCDISIREIQRLFQKYVGVTPKIYSKLIRVKMAKEKISQDDFSSLADLSVDIGYFDQAHFNKDFKTYMEETPKKYKVLKSKKKN
ncbi:DNA-binding helix-turn-helix protein [Bacteriovorax sp. BSW11_IV]|uniref:helix-turn-helix transcriptional regulator n=1 Tax=Bacteriovorax sp. BSW11_IV TaxID=1353529 RepID=UPI000389E8D3|nr:helix-turn-helix transcriptional regulator [Bacteriovorax sp. BSW11_IV]EQC48307.1 DNA-binding helix-turn-helix protein [Bacteriovorax sp. BSW11_IV]